jgi:hypothetical protein
VVAAGACGAAGAGAGLPNKKPVAATGAGLRNEKPVADTDGTCSTDALSRLALPFVDRQNGSPGCSSE